MHLKAVVAKVDDEDLIVTKLRHSAGGSGKATLDVRGQSNHQIEDDIKS